MQFLSYQEAQLIKRDFKEFLNSYEVCDIEIHYRVPSGTVTENDVYDVTRATSWIDRFIKTRASQKIVTPTNENILAWGIIQVGDCLFFISEAVDLTEINYDSAYIKCPSSIQGEYQEWTPLKIDQNALLDYLGFRLGNDQVAQVLACRTKQ